MIDKMEDSRTIVVVVTSNLVSSCLRKWEENLSENDLNELRVRLETHAHESCNELSASCCAQVQFRQIIHQNIFDWKEYFLSTVADITAPGT